MARPLGALPSPSRPQPWAVNALSLPRLKLLDVPFVVIGIDVVGYAIIIQVAILPLGQLRPISVRVR